jgi:signal transduction histidine kinase
MLKSLSFPYRVTLLYIFFGVLWILFSDQLVVSLTTDPHKIHLLSTYKGWFFIMVTGIMLFYLVRSEIRRRTLIFNELLDAKKKAEASERLKTTFLSNLSHYIRTPMNGILGFVQLLEDKDLSPEKHRLFLSYINSSSQHLLYTLNTIVEISKIQEGQVNVFLQTFNVNDLINRIIAVARIDVAEKNKQLILKASHGFAHKDDLITADREKIAQILSNLLSNAVNFSDKGEIEICTFKTDDELIFVVQDCGRGIPEERKEMLFTEFLLNTSTTCVVGEGAGLGLPLSAGLAKLLGGRLWLDYSNENGSKFCFSVPWIT